MADVLIAGGGLAGITAAHELLDLGKKVLLVEKGDKESFGGLAKESFGGVHMIGTPHQKKMGVSDSPDLAYRDWLAYGEFGPGEERGKEWAKFYCDASREWIFDFLSDKQIQFLPLVNWTERGMFRPGNSVPRWHITWGTGYEIIARMLEALERHPKRSNLEILYEHEVSGFETQGDRVVGAQLKRMSDGAASTARAEHVVVASGGICGGDLSKVRANWFKPWGAPPKVLLNGAHKFGDGMLHDRVAALGGRLTHLDRQWHYAAGVHHPAKRRPHDGLSLVPPRSALWMNARGERIGPIPLVSYFDTRFLVEQILKQPGQYSWQVMNWKIAIKELAVSGGDFMKAFRFKKKLQIFKDVAFGNKELVNRLIAECPDDMVVAPTLEALVQKMNERSLDGQRVDFFAMKSAIEEYDAQIDRGPRFFVDDQLRRIANMRANRGDRLRICKFQKILDPKAGPLIAIREFILARKSLGGIQTDMKCRALKGDGTPIPGLYAVGEAAGFGGGGIHGIRSLEGTFLGGCVLTGRAAARAIAGA